MKSMNYSRRLYLKTAGMMGIATTLGNIRATHAASATQTSATLNILNAKSYIADNTLAQFKQRSHYTVQMDTYRSQSDLISLLLSRSPKYDVVIIPSFLANRLHNAKLLNPLKHHKIPNIKHLDTGFMQPDYDPTRQFSLPYLWSIMGVGYRTTSVRGKLDSWQSVFDSKRYSGKIALHPNPKVLFKCALKYLGYQGPTTARALKEAEQLLIKQKAHVHFLTTVDMQKALLQKPYPIAMGWNGYILQNMQQNKKIHYMTPKEGSVIWEDCLCIPRRAPHQEAAHEFINFILEPDIGATIAQQTRYATPNKTALRQLPESYTQNRAIFPDKTILGRSEVLLDEGNYVHQLYNASMRRVMAASD